VNTEPAHYMADISCNYAASIDKMSINTYVKNITNRVEKTGFMRSDLRIGPPRIYEAVLSIRS